MFSFCPRKLTEAAREEFTKTEERTPRWIILVKLAVLGVFLKDCYKLSKTD